MFSKYLCSVCLETPKVKASELWSRGLFQPPVQEVQAEEQLLQNCDLEMLRLDHSEGRAGLVLSANVE